MKKILITDLELHGLLVFSKHQTSLKDDTAITSPGPVIRTSGYIHNYPLIYGLLGYSSESMLSLGEPRYSVVEEAVDNELYAYPAEPLRVKYTRLLLTTQPETLVKYKIRAKYSHPLQVHYYAAAPGSTYRTVIIHGPGRIVPRYIRIGKKRWGLLKLRTFQAESIEEVEPTFSSIPVNLGDMAGMGVEILDKRTVLVTRNYPLIGDRAVVAYVKAEPTYRVTYTRHGKPRTIYIPIPKTLL